VGIADAKYRSFDQCALCGSTELQVIRKEKNTFDPADPILAPYLLEPSVMKCCSRCGFAFVGQIPQDLDFFKYYYKQQHLDPSLLFFHSGKKLVFKEAKKKILKFKRDGDLLDIGAGVGLFISTMGEHFKCKGIEISSHFVEYGKRQGLDLQVGSFMEASFQKNSLDVITIIDVLEHLPEPQKVLIKAQEILKPGGIIYIKVPNYKMQILKQSIRNALHLSPIGVMENFGHINHFSIPSLSHFLEKHAFEVLQSGFSQPEVWDLSLMAPFKEKLSRITMHVGHRIFTFLLNSLAWITHLPIGFNLILIAKKK